MECNQLKFVSETNQFLSWNKPSKQKNFEKINITFLAEIFCKKLPPIEVTHVEIF